MIRLFVGFDPREAVAYHTFCQSVLEKASQPVSFTPLVLKALPGYTETHTDGSNTFIYSRFLTPHLCNFDGWALFADGDMICRDDITKLWALRDPSKALMVVQHDYQTKAAVKYLGNKNQNYPRKNWSSVMLFNNAACKALTPEYVNKASGLELHQFKWLDRDDQIGGLPAEWNHLVGYDAHRRGAALVHYTSGGPWFLEYKDCEYADEWFTERDKMLQVLREERRKASSAT